MRLRWRALAAMLVVLGWAGGAAALETWEAELTVTAGAAENRLRFGQHPQAGDGLDPRFDVPAMLAGTVQAYFDLDGAPYWRDIKGARPPAAKTWVLTVRPPGNGLPVLIRWQAASMPSALSVTLTDPEADLRIDMSREGQHSLKIVESKQLIIQSKPREAESWRK